MTENTTVAKITISKDNANKLVKSVKDGMALVNKGYLAITPDVARLYDTKAFEVLGYKNFDELCVNEFGMSHGTTVGIRKVFALYGSKSSKDGSYTIPEKYTEFGYTKLLLFATDKKKFDDAGINPIEEFNPKMTIGEMKAHLRSVLDNKAKDQDANAIETTATEAADEKSIIDNSEATATETEATAAETNENNDTFDVFESIATDASTIRAMFGETKDAKIIANLDSLDAIIKELKKLYKKNNK